MAERSYAEVVASAHAEERELVAVERFADPADTEGATLPWQWIRYQFGAMVR